MIYEIVIIGWKLFNTWNFRITYNKSHIYEPSAVFSFWKMLRPWMEHSIVTNHQPVPGPWWGSNVSCFLFLSWKVWAIRLYLPSLGTRDVLQYIKFNFLGRLYQPGTLDMMTSCRTTEHNPTNTRKSGTVRERHWTLNGLFFWENIISDSVFLPLIGLVLSSYSSLGLCLGVCPPALQVHLCWIYFTVVSSFISLDFSLLWSIRATRTAGSSTWNWWAQGEYCGERERERESHPGTGDRAGAVSGGRGGWSGPVSPLITPR